MTKKKGIFSIGIVGLLLGLARCASAQAPEAPPPIEEGALNEDAFARKDVAPAEPSAVDTATNEEALSEPAPSLDEFKEVLTPYGHWRKTPEYGLVWIPSISDPFWRPYTYGEWAYTSAGWTFVSYHPWGWVPFHYGRWVYLSGFGWSWVPGYAWGPAWVTWRYGDDFIAWAPLAPTTIGIAYYEAPSLWIGLRATYFGRPMVRRYFLPTSRVHAAFRKTHFANVQPRHVTPGPPVPFVQKATGRPVGIVRGRTVAPRRGRAEDVRPHRDPAPRKGRPAPRKETDHPARPPHETRGRTTPHHGSRPERPSK